MTPTDVKALKPGQRVLVGAEVADPPIDRNCINLLIEGAKGWQPTWALPHAIHSVLPDPIKVGDRVKDAIGLVGTVLDMVEPMVCIRFCKPINGSIYGERLLTSLERI